MNAVTEDEPGTSPRLAPEMASFRLLVLAFVRDYIAANGQGPSYGEIAAGLRSNRERVRKSAKRLVRDGQLIRVPGPRGLKLPSLIEEAKRQLRAAGYVIDEDIGAGQLPVTNRPLLPPAELRYPDPRTDGRKGNDGEQAGKPRRARAR